MDKKNFDPEKYGMIICPGCHGHGFIEDDDGRNVCLTCGGFGFIKKDEAPRENDDG
jgi:DnaJ-class molecular chaperone